MKRAILTCALLGLLASIGQADGRKPGSALVYPVHRSGVPDDDAQEVGTLPPDPFFTLVCVTNTNTHPVSGGTNVHMEFVNVAPDWTDPFKPLYCSVQNRTEYLTPADVRCFLVNCVNPGPLTEGYLVMSAQDPSSFQTPWSHDYLVGSEIVVNAASAIYQLNAIPFDSPQAPGAPTDVDGDGQLDFDGIEYEGVPDELYLDVFMPMMSPSLALLNLTGGTAFDASVAFTVFNDNEFALSTTLEFRCWFDQPLRRISLIFDETFLAMNTPDDPTEVDTNCDYVGDLESGWARIDGLNASSSAESIADPALLGAVTAPTQQIFNIGGGRLLWESVDLQLNGDFLKTGVDDPEH